MAVCRGPCRRRVRPVGRRASGSNASCSSDTRRTPSTGRAPGAACSRREHRGWAGRRALPAACPPAGRPRRRRARRSARAGSRPCPCPSRTLHSGRRTTARRMPHTTTAPTSAQAAARPASRLHRPVRGCRGVNARGMGVGGQTGQSATQACKRVSGSERQRDGGGGPDRPVGYTGL